MGTRGPLPNPNARRRNLRPAPRGTITTGRPRAPRGLGAEGRAEWRRVIAHLEELGAVTPVDRALLYRYCRTWEEWVELEETVKATGLLVRGAGNAVIRNPALRLRRDAEATLLELGRELALSPASRLRLNIEHQEADVGDSPADELVDEGTLLVMAEYRKMFGAG